MAKPYIFHHTNKNLLRSIAFFHPAIELVEMRHPLCSAQKNAIPHRFGLRFFCFYKGRSRFSFRYATIKTLHFLPSSTRSRLAAFRLFVPGVSSFLHLPHTSVLRSSRSLRTSVFPSLAQGCFSFFTPNHIQFSGIRSSI